MKRILLSILILAQLASCSGQCDSSYNRIEILDNQGQVATCIAQGEVYVILSYSVDPNNTRDSTNIWCKIEDENGLPVSQIDVTLNTGGQAATWDTFGTEVWAYTRRANWLGWGWTTWGMFLRWSTLGIRMYAVTPGPWVISSVDTTWGLIDTCIHRDTLVVPACSVLQVQYPQERPAPEPIIERREYEYYEFGTFREVLCPMPRRLYRRVDVGDGSGIYTVIIE